MAKEINTSDGEFNLHARCVHCVHCLVSHHFSHSLFFNKLFTFNDSNHEWLVEEYKYILCFLCCIIILCTVPYITVIKCCSFLNDITVYYSNLPQMTYAGNVIVETNVV